MGAWGTEPFDNDDALDFIGQLQDLSAEEVPERLAEVFKVANEYVDVEEGNYVLAAIGLIVARRVGHVNNTQAADFLQDCPFEISDELLADARLALGKVWCDNSELWVLWEETDEFEQAGKVITNLKRKLM